MRFETYIRPLDLGLTLGCGQTFRWAEAQPGVWTGIIRKLQMSISESSGLLTIETPSRSSQATGFVREYLRAEDDIQTIQKTLANDPAMARGMQRFQGLRIVKMDEWECLISYMLATYANIPRIKKMIDSISAHYGEPIRGGVYAFPTLRRLSEASERDLTKCGLGYRSKYVVRLCESMTESRLRSMTRLEYPDLRMQLIELPGVGDKVADCVSLFGFGKLEAFPIDVWIERALGRLYKVKGSYQKLSEFASKRFGEYAGYAQEYLYFNERAVADDSACSFS